MIPLVAVLTCAAYICRAWMELGYLPSYGNPDPKILNWPFHHFLVLSGILAVYPAVIWSSSLSLLLLYRRSHASGIAILMASVFIVIALQGLAQLPAIDDFFAWYLD